MKRLTILAALLTLSVSAIGCGQGGGFGNLCRRRTSNCDQCQTYAGMPTGGMVYDGVIEQGVVEEIPAGKASTR